MYEHYELQCSVWLDFVEFRGRYNGLDRAFNNTTLNASPTQLVFGRDAILNTTFEANWEVIRERKQKRIDYNNRKENAKRIAHEYRINDKVLLRDKGPKEIENKFGTIEWEGPFRITNVNKQNGTVQIRQGSLIKTYNIRKIKPYIE